MESRASPPGESWGAGGWSGGTGAGALTPGIPFWKDIRDPVAAISSGRAAAAGPVGQR